MSLDPQDRNTDKYYKNKKPGSAFAQSAADSTRKPRQVLPPGYSPVVTPNFNRDDNTTAKYYATGGSPSAGAGQPIAKPQGKLPFKAVDPAAAAAYGVVLIEIPDAKYLGEGVAAAKAAVLGGSKVEIAVSDKTLIPRIAVALDGAVSREEITEDQRREVRVGVRNMDYQTANRALLPAENRSPDEVFGAPVASGTKQVAASPDDDLDIDAFLAGGAVDAEDEKHAALTGGTAAGGTPPPPEPEPEEDNDFLAPVGTTPSPETLAGLGPDLSKVPQQPKE